MAALAKPKKVMVPGYVECEWLLDDYRQMALNDIKAMMQKGEADLMRMARKVIIHSRTMAPGGSAREGEEGPGVVASPSPSTYRQLDTNWNASAGIEQLEREVAEPNRRVRR